MSVVMDKRPGLRLPSLPKKSAGSAVPRSSKERVWLVAGGTVAVLMTVIAYFFFISPQRSETSDVQGRVDSAKSQNDVLQGRLDQLREQSKNIGKYKADLVAAHNALPSTSGVSDFLRVLQSLGGQTQTNVVSLTVGQPLDVSAIASGQLVPGAAPVAAPAATGAAPTGAAAANGAANGPAGTAATAAAGPRVYALPITAQVTGTPANLTKFLDQLQNVQPRAVLIASLVEASTTAVGAQPVKPSGSTTLQLVMGAFVAPATPGVPAAPSVPASAAASSGPK